MGANTVLIPGQLHFGPYVTVSLEGHLILSISAKGILVIMKLLKRH